MTPRPKRPRAVGYKYSKNACRTCRIRRVKCDETSGSCQRCTSAGRVCGGYAYHKPRDHEAIIRPLRPAPPSFPTEHSATVRSGDSSAHGARLCMYCADPTACECRARPDSAYGCHEPRTHLLRICPRPSALSITLNGAEGNALDFFRRVTLSQLPCASILEKPLEHVIMVLTYQQPTVAAAGCALASLHRALTDSQGHDQHQLALQQYNKSLALMHNFISGLQDNNTENAILVVLVVCLIFFTYEAFSENDARASMHLLTGLRVIHEQCSGREKFLSTQNEHVVFVDRGSGSMYGVLRQAYIRIDSDYRLISHDHSYLRPSSEKALPSIFQELDEATMHLEVIKTKMYNHFDAIYTYANRTFSEPELLDCLEIDLRMCLLRATLRSLNFDKASHLLLGAEEIRQHLRVWAEAFEMLPRTSENLKSHISAEIYFYCLWIWMEVWRDENASLIDRFEQRFIYLTDLCEQYLDLHITRTPSYNIFNGCNADDKRRFATPPTFSLGSYVVRCLTVVVENCRTSAVRQRCIALLRKINMRGVFDTSYLAAYLQAVVDHEEQAARRLNPGADISSDLKACDVPEGARLLERQMSPSYTRTRFDFYTTNRVNLVYVIKENNGTGHRLQLGCLAVSVSR